MSELGGSARAWASMVAALLSSTSSVIHASSLGNVFKQTRSGLVEPHFFGQHGRLKQTRPHIFAPPGCSQSQDLVLHDGGRRPHVQHIHWASRQVGERPAQGKERHGVGTALHQHRQIKIAVSACPLPLVLNAAAKRSDRQQAGQAGLELGNQWINLHF